MVSLSKTTRYPHSNMRVALGKDGGILAKNTSMLYLMTIAKYIFPLLLFPYLTRVLTVNYYGIITYMTSVANYISIVIDFGFNFSATRKIAQNKNNTEKIKEIYTSVIIAKLALALCSGIAVGAISPFIPILRDNINVLLAYYFSTAVLAFLPDFVYRGFEQMQGITLRYVISKVITTVLTILMVKGPEQILLVPIFNGIGNLFSIFFTWAHLKKFFDISFKKIKLQFCFNEIRDSSVFFVSTFASTAFTLANTLFMGIVVMSESDIACWGVAFQLITIAMSLYEPITSSLYPRMVQSRNLKIIRIAIVLVLPVIIVGIIICYFGASLFVNIVAGAGYEAAVPVFQIMLPVLLFTYPAQILGFPVLGAVHQEKYATRATVISAVFHIFGLIVLALTHSFTLISVAILRTCTEFVFMIFRVKYYYKIKYLFAGDNNYE